MQPLQLLSRKYFNAYSKSVSIRIDVSKNISLKNFERFISVASVTSSQIEGSSTDVNSFFRKKELKKKDHETRDIENLIAAYKFAAANTISRTNILKAHKILSKGFLENIHCGKFRKGSVFVVNQRTGELVYAAADAKIVNREVKKLLSDITFLLAQKLTTKESFYFASLIHLWFAKIHPYNDGNGRAARLLEKWFLSSAIGEVAWSIPAEVYYWENRPAYYKNLALIGTDYESLNWNKCASFLNMLPNSLRL